jgi:hypothetical protein
MLVLGMFNYSLLPSSPPPVFLYFYTGWGGMVEMVELDVWMPGNFLFFIFYFHFLFFVHNPTLLCPKF